MPKYCLYGILWIPCGMNLNDNDMRTEVRVTLTDERGEKDNFVAWINLPREEAIKNYMGKTFNNGPRYEDGKCIEDWMMEVTEVEVLSEKKHDLVELLIGLTYGYEPVNVKGEGYRVSRLSALNRDPMIFDAFAKYHGMERIWLDGVSGYWVDRDNMQDMAYVEGDVLVGDYYRGDVMEREISRAIKAHE